MPHDSEFGIWKLPATIGAVRLAAFCQFEPAHYDAAERKARKLGAREINRDHVAQVQVMIENYQAAICQQCGLFHTPPACEVPFIDSRAL